MRAFASLLALAQVATLAHGFLVPPSLTAEQVEEAFKDVEIKNSGFGAMGLLAEGESRVVRLPCKGCVWSDETGVASDLLFDFTRPAARPSDLLLNSHKLLPLPASHDAPLTATQLPSTQSLSSLLLSPEAPHTAALDYTLLMHSALIPFSSHPYKSTVIELRIHGVNGVATPGFDGIRFSVKENPSTGELSWDTVEIVEGGRGMCDTWSCMVKEYLERAAEAGKAGLKKVKGHCGGKKHGGKVDGKVRGGSHHGGHHHQAPPHAHKYYKNVFERVVKQVLVPVMIGILAGMSVSILGLLVGHFSVLLWRKFKGVKKEQRLLTDDHECEKGLLSEEHQEEEAPPAYVHDGVEVVEKE